MFIVSLTALTLEKNMLFISTPTKEEQSQFPQQKKQWEDDSGESTPEHAHREEEDEEYIIEESSVRGDRQDRQGVMTDPERNAVQPQDGDHLMSGSDGEEGQAEEADQVRDTEESVEEAEPVLRRSTRYRRPPDRYGNPLNLPDLESDDDT